MAIAIKNGATSQKKMQATQKQPELTVISRVIKGDTYMVMADAARELEDEFANLYYIPGERTEGTLAVLPPYTPKTLKGLVKQNNILNQCVHAMEVNIDGTGHEFVPSVENEEMDETELQAASQFFDEPYPGVSFVTVRRALRQDLESIGYGFLEILRAINGEIVGLRHVEGQTMRLVRLGDPMEVTKTVLRGGQELPLRLRERPRRFVQSFNGQGKQYFKEFGVDRDLDRMTGEWAPEGTKLPPDRKATEVVFFGIDRDYNGPYYVPRWINQLPSVLGSRKAEEANLEFFDSGGMPPAIIFVQGGNMVGESAAQLRTYLSASNRKKGRAVVVELQSNSGTIESSGSVSAKVERFGSGQDAMYEKYDAKTEEHVRVGFRLPPLFIGRSADYNYATAVVAYQVAEAQVFQPERTEFDEIINRTLVRAMGWKTLRFKSMPITMKSVDEFFRGMELLDGKVNAEGFVREVNKVLGIDLEYDPNAVPPAPKLAPDQAQLADPAETPEMTEKLGTDRLTMLKLVRRTAEMEGLVEPITEMDDDSKYVIRKSVEALTGGDKDLFDQLLTAYAQPHDDHGHC